MSSVCRRNGTVLIGTRAVEQQEVNPKNTIYDAKRFIGKTFRPDDPNFLVSLGCFRVISFCSAVGFYAAAFWHSIFVCTRRNIHLTVFEKLKREF
jgi:hypothetical protein